MQIHPVAAALIDADRRTDRQRTGMTKVTGDFRDYVYSSKNKSLHQYINRKNHSRAAWEISIELHENARK